MGIFANTALLFQFTAILLSPHFQNRRPPYTMHGVLHFLQHEWSKYEMEKAKWEMERAEMQVRFLLD